MTTYGYLLILGLLVAFCIGSYILLYIEQNNAHKRNMERIRQDEFMKKVEKFKF